MSRPLVGDETGLAAYFPFREGRGRKIYDVSPAGVHAFLPNDATRVLIDDHPVPLDTSTSRRSQFAPLRADIRPYSAFLTGDFICLISPFLTSAASSSVFSFFSVHDGHDEMCDSVLTNEIPLIAWSCDDHGNAWSIDQSSNVTFFPLPVPAREVAGSPVPQLLGEHLVSAHQVATNIHLNACCLSQHDLGLWLLCLVAFAVDKYVPSHNAIFFSPFAVDIDCEMLRSALDILQDHFRVVQGVSARRATSVRTEHSAFAICTVLRAVKKQMEIIAIHRLNPASLDLEIPLASGQGEVLSQLSASRRGLHSPLTTSTPLNVDASTMPSSSSVSVGSMLLSSLSNMVNDDSTISLLSSGGVPSPCLRHSTKRCEAVLPFSEGARYVAQRNSVQRTDKEGIRSIVVERYCR